MRAYFKAYRKSHTSLYGTSLTVTYFDDGGSELCYISMPTKSLAISRHNFIGDYASVVLHDHFGGQVTKSGLDMAMSLYPTGPYRYHPKD